MSTIRLSLTTLLVAGLAQAAAAQSNIDGTNKFGWGENVGYFNFRDAGNPAGTQGAVLGAVGLKGYVWQENTGWMNLGATGGPYLNTNNTNYGVNLQVDNRLSGFAWCENIGWANFGIHAGLPAAQQARYDPAARRFRGYVWLENAGWLNLDDATKFVGLTCCVDYNMDFEVDFSDIEGFLAALAAQTPGSCAPGADWNNDFEFDFSDIEVFLAAYNAGCS